MAAPSPTQRIALAAVAAAADELHAARERRRQTIRKARQEGATLRAIAAEALISREQVRRICAEREPGEAFGGRE